MSGKRITEILEKSSSQDETALVVTSYADDAIIAGTGFVFQKNFTIAIAGTLYVLVDYSTYTTTESWQTGNVYIFPPQYTTTAGTVQVHVYRGTDYSGGTEFDAINPNTNATKTTSGTTLTYEATGTVKGTESLTYLVGIASTNQFSGGGPAEGATFFVRPNTAKTLVEIVNESGEEIIFHYGQVLYEI